MSLWLWGLGGMMLGITLAFLFGSLPSSWHYILLVLLLGSLAIYQIRRWYIDR